MTSDARPRVLYLVYWGAAEPLGQSIVLPPVTRLAAMGTAVTLITFEKAADLKRSSEMQRITAILTRCAVKWRPIHYHKWPKAPAKVLDVLHGVGTGIREAIRHRINIVHARTFIGGVVGMLLAPLVGAKLVYHAEGFYPDEQVDGGVWRKGSLPHRVAGLVERALYARAHGIVVLSERARTQVEQLPVIRHRATPVVVVPSCVDLALFPPIQRARWQPGQTLRLVYVGSIGHRYLFDRVAEFVALAHRRRPGRVTLRVLTRTAPQDVETTLRSMGVPREVWSVGSVPHRQIPKELAQQDAGLFVVARGLSEHGCSPTKVGEYWASGLPVIITRNVSDTEDIIRRERVGVLLPDFSEEAYERALDELLALLDDPDLSRRCRAAAERYYALEPACDRLQALYRLVVGECSPPGGGFQDGRVATQEETRA